MLIYLSALQVAVPSDPIQLLWLLIVLLITGLIAIVALGFLFAFPIAAIAAIIVWFITGGDLFLTGLTFMIAALITASIGRLWQAANLKKSNRQTKLKVNFKKENVYFKSNFEKKQSMLKNAENEPLLSS